jgi:solute carrier family 25 uncoupling protein 27
MGGGPDKTGLSLPTTYVLSAAASCIAETVTFPSDIVKTRLQVQHSAKPGVGGPPPRGIFATAAGIVREEGAAALYKGLAPACLRHLVYSGTRVVVYEAMRETVLGRNPDGSFPLWKGILAAMSAGAIGQFIASPTDLVKVRMQTDGKRVAAGLPPQFRGTLDAFRQLHAENGLRGMWKGWVPNCQRAALVQLGDLAAYDFFKQSYLDAGVVTDGPAGHALSAFSAGLVAVVMSSPADVVKSRVMSQPVDPATGKGLVCVPQSSRVFKTKECNMYRCTVQCRGAKD